MASEFRDFLKPLHLNIQRFKQQRMQMTQYFSNKPFTYSELILLKSFTILIIFGIAHRPVLTEIKKDKTHNLLTCL